MNRLRFLIGVGLLTALLSGCADPSALPTDDEGFQDLELEATDTTGVIRGVVVDTSIVPVPGATVLLDGADGLSTTTNADGAFGFSDVSPGVHQLLIDKTGFQATQSSVDVVAGVDKPQVVKVLLQHDASELPYVQGFQFSGYIECSASSPAYRVAACSLANIVTDTLGQPPISEDNFLVGFDILQDPDFVQAEMIWESTQALGDYLTMVVEVDPLDGHDIGSVNGTSPLVLTAHKDKIVAAGMDKSGHIQERVFNFERPETTPPVPVCGIPNPVHGGTMCLKGVGLTISQDFEIFTHVTYRFTPPERWQFSRDGAPMPPA